jgi:uncharacterized membrane protein YecN with MAPEG domain
MPTGLLIIINFVIIISLIKLIINKYSKYKINKGDISNDNLSYMKERVVRFNNVIIVLNLIFLFFNTYIKFDSLIINIITSIIVVIDMVYATSLGDKHD